MTLNWRKSVIWVRIVAAFVMLVSSLAPAGAAPHSMDMRGAAAMHAAQSVKAASHDHSADHHGAVASKTSDDNCASSEAQDHHSPADHANGGCCSAACFPFALNNHDFSLAMPAKPVLDNDALAVLISTEALLLDRPPRI